MIKKLYICSDDKNIFDKLSLLSWNNNLIEILNIDVQSFHINPKFDIIHIPTTFAEKLNSIPMNLDCQIIETNNLYGWPKYIVTSPGFADFNELSDYKMLLLQISIPLKKVIDFSNQTKIPLIYAIHTEFTFGYFKDIEFDYKEIKNIIECTIEKHN